MNIVVTTVSLSLLSGRQFGGDIVEVEEFLLEVCKELIDDAADGCAHLVFKDICLEILAKAKLVLSDDSFGKLKEHAVEKIKEKTKKKTE